MCVCVVCEAGRDRAVPERTKRRTGQGAERARPATLRGALGPAPHSSAANGSGCWGGRGRTANSGTAAGGKAGSRAGRTEYSRIQPSASRALPRWAESNRVQPNSAEPEPSSTGMARVEPESNRTEPSPNRALPRWAELSPSLTEPKRAESPHGLRGKLLKDFKF